MPHEITLVAAIAMTSRYRSQHPNNYPICETFDISAVQKLLATPGASFLRIYYGLKEDGKMDAILVAADSDNKDILPASEDPLINADPGPVILQDGFRCPPACPPPSPLNT